MKCEECNEGAAEVCVECEENLCLRCSARLHNGGKRRYHERRKICQSCMIISNIFCNNCQKPICKKCEVIHLTHQLVFTKKTVIYWDSAFISNIYQKHLLSFLERIQPNSIRIYSKKPKKIEVSNNISIVPRPFSFAQVFISDIQNDIRYGMTDCYIISDLTDFIRKTVCSELTLINFYHLDPITLMLEPLGFSYVVHFFYSKFLKGKVLLERSRALKKLSLIGKKTESELNVILEQLQNMGSIYCITKDFNQFRLRQFGLKLQEINNNVCLGILRSLKLDEIFPSEKAIQSRIREIFLLKLSQSEWKEIIKDMQNAKIDSSFSLFSQEVAENQFVFKEVVYEEERTFAIFPKGGEWLAPDTIAVQTIKNGPEWKNMLEFLAGFFKNNQSFTTLSGGKYGCALLLKYFSSRSLYKLSIGRLSYMVQIAINEDVMRYQKTLLIWTEDFQVTLPETIVQEKISTIRLEINKMLKKKPSGVPLAQIPINLKRKLKSPIKISELGFKKLKDLLSQFPEVYLFPSNSKNPSAFLNENYNLAAIKSFIVSLNSKNSSVLVERLQQDLLQEFGLIDWKLYECSSLGEFIELHCKGVMIVKAENENTVKENDREEVSISTHNSEYFSANLCELSLSDEVGE